MKQLYSMITLICVVLPNICLGNPFETSKWQTKNGAQVVFYQAMEVPMLDISVAFRAGSAYDGEQFGLSALTTQLLNQGSGGLDANKLADTLAKTGAQFDKATNQDMIVCNLKTLTRPDALKKATELFTSILTHPDFPEEAFNREKNQQLMAITEAQESPNELANQTFFQVLYKAHPYAHPVMGNQKTVSAITREQVLQFYHQFFVSQNAIIVLVGAIDASTAKILAENISQNLPKGPPAPEIPAAKKLNEALDIEVTFPASQTVIRLGQLGITHLDRDYFPLLVGNYIFGGGALVSRLSEEIREKRGLTYGVSSQFYPMPGVGPFLISLSTKNNQAKTAIDLTRAALSRFVKSGPSEQELQAAIQYLSGSFPLSLASNRNIGDMLLKIAFYHLPDDFLQTYIAHIHAVSRDEIKTAFQRVIEPNQLLQVTVGKSR